MSYATLQDLKDRYLEQDLIQLSDPQAQVLQENVLLRALDDAESEINSYLAERYTLPFVNPPAVLTRLACELAMYHMMVLRQMGDLEGINARYRHSVEFLKGVNAGRFVLGVAASQAPASTAFGVRINAAPSRFSKSEFMGGLR